MSNSENPNPQQSLNVALFPQADENIDDNSNNSDERFQQNIEISKCLLQEPIKLIDVITEEEIPRIYVALYEIWIETGLSPEEQARRNFAEFLSPEQKSKQGDDRFADEEALNFAFDQIKYQWGGLTYRIANTNQKDFIEAVYDLKPSRLLYEDYTKALSVIAETTYYAHSILFDICRLKTIKSGNYVQCLPDSINFRKFSYYDTSKNTNYQDVLLYLYKHLYENKLRKKGTDVFRQITTKVVNLEVEYDDGSRNVESVGGFCTHAWERKQGIEELVCGTIKKDENYEGWRKLTSGNSIKPIVDNLTKLEDPDFPSLVRDRHIFSFEDGIYDARYDDFYEYDYKTPLDTIKTVEELNSFRVELENLLSFTKEEQDKAMILRVERQIKLLEGITRHKGSDMLGYDIISANYISRKFIPTECDDFVDYYESCVKWEDIPTPNFDRIIDHQEFDHYQQVECINVKCKNRAKYSVQYDNRGRYCEIHKTDDMIDIVTPRCNDGGCQNFAIFKDTADNAALNGREIAYFCEKHNLEDGTEEFDPQSEIGQHHGIVPSYTEKNILYAIIGRLIYDIGTNDNWQVIGFLKGLAQTGKSTIVKIIKSFYSADDCHVLSNNIEKKFGLEPLMEKFLFLAPEIKENLGLDQAEFQSIVSGDPMSIARKFRSAISIDWKVPGLLAGNVPPKWSDKAGSIARRVLVFPFDKAVKHSDGNLEHEILKEIPQIIRKANLAYIALAKDLKAHNKGIWDIVPKRLLNARKELQQRVSELGEFFQLNKSIKVADGPDAKSEYVPWDIFTEKYTQWAKESRKNHPGSLDLKEFSAFFDSIGVEIDYDEDENQIPRSRVWPGDNCQHKGPFLYGLRCIDV